MGLLLIGIVWALMASSADVTLKTHGADVKPRDTSNIVVPQECFDDNGNFDPDLGHDTLDCGNL